LFWGDGGEPLGFEELDAGSLSSEVGFEAHEDERGIGAEMGDFRIPLERVSAFHFKQTCTYLVHDIL
jgi:hypothetical protein